MSPTASSLETTWAAVDSSVEASVLSSVEASVDASVDSSVEACVNVLFAVQFVFLSQMRSVRLDYNIQFLFYILQVQIKVLQKVKKQE